MQGLPSDPQNRPRQCREQGEPRQAELAEAVPPCGFIPSGHLGQVEERAGASPVGCFSAPDRRACTTVQRSLGRLLFATGGRKPSCRRQLSAARGDVGGDVRTPARVKPGPSLSMEPCALLATSPTFEGSAGYDRAFGQFGCACSCSSPSRWGPGGAASPASL